MSDTRARMEPYYPYGFSFLSKLGKRHHTGGGGHKGDILKQVASVGKREVEARDLEYLTTGKPKIVISFIFKHVLSVILIQGFNFALS